MTNGRRLKLAIAGFLSLAAALGIGRFVYTPILPFMIDALGLTKSQAGFIASANYLGYLIGAGLATAPRFSSNSKEYLLAGLAISFLTTLAMGMSAGLLYFVFLRLIGGISSAIVIVSASGLVLGEAEKPSHAVTPALHFAGVGGGIFISALTISLISTKIADWRVMWVAGGLVSLILIAPVMVLIRGARPNFSGKGTKSVDRHRSRGATLMITAYGLFGFGYVITATFLVAIVRESAQLRDFEFSIWILFGLAAIPSVYLWTTLGEKHGVRATFAVACVIEALGVASSVEWQTPTGILLSTVLLGATFMGLTALGLIAGRELSPVDPDRMIARMTLSFAAGQMIGPAFAGVLVDHLGSFRVPSLLAAGALVVAGILASCIRVWHERTGVSSTGSGHAR